MRSFLFTDIEGSTRLWEDNPESMREALTRHDSLLRRAVESHSGHVFKTVGDAFCAAFASAHQGVTAALEAQQALCREPFGVGPLRVRMAVHTGPAEERDRDFFGPTVNRVARLLSIGHGEQVLLSAVTRDLVQGGMPEGASLVDMGIHRLKDLADPEHVYQLLHPELPHTFPALRSLNSLPNNLPHELTRFVGRDQEMETIKKLLEEGRLTTLVGAGGVGKSRLALQVGADLLDRYADGVWLVELAPLSDPTLVPQAVGQALGLRDEAGRSLVQSLVDYLKPKTVLLLLDNCEHVLTASASLVESLLRACPCARVLATSREALGIVGEQSYRVPSLTVPQAGANESAETLDQYEASRLFIERLRLHEPGFVVTDQEAPFLASICRRLDGIPLALELAAARVRSLSLEELNARLDNRFRLLTGGSRTALPRQQTLRALIDWSFNLLSEAERLLLARLSVFAGGWSLGAAEAVCSGSGIQECEVLDLLTALVEKSLVVFEGGGEARYRLLETIRQYAREKLIEAENPEAAWQRHLGYFLARAEEAAPHLYGAEQGTWQHRLERDHDNLRRALEWSLTSDDGTEAGLRLVGSLEMFWLIGSHLREAGEWTTRALERSRLAPPLVLARALESATTAQFFLGDYEGAAALAQEALTYADAAQDRARIASALFRVAIVAAHRGHLEVAQVSADRGISLAREEADHWLIGRFLLTLGILSWMRGDYTPARTHLKESLQVSREAADYWQIAMTLANLGVVSRRDSDLDGALALHREGLVLCMRLGDRRGAAWHLVGIAGVETEQGRAERAARLLGAAAAVMDAVGSPLPPPQHLERIRTSEQTEAALGVDQFAAGLAQGREQTLEQAAAYALGEADLDPLSGVL
jgi:predicted ATPase/class 3 adenylate cyclase